MSARRTVAAGMLASAIAVTGFVSPAHAAGSGPGHEATQRAMEELVASGTPGVVAQAKDGDGVWKSTAGVGDRESGAPRGADDRFRVGSITKTFVATVLLQMEAEGRLDLDDTVEKHLPGLVTGNGNDGSAITVRQLLNHTSGLFNYTSDTGFQNERFYLPGFFEHRYTPQTPEQLVRIALAHRPDFTPGARHEYSNTNYILAGLIVEKVSGKTYEHQVKKRILKPLKLRGTSLPVNRPTLPGPSGRAYSKLSPDQAATKIHDVTELNASIAWAAGDMISTTGDLNRFYSALMRGKLFPKEQLTAMRTTVDGYGLGIATATLGCGKEVWGHGGGIHGSGSLALTTPDGGHSLSANVNADWGQGMGALMNAEFCGDSTGAKTADIAGTSSIN